MCAKITLFFTKYNIDPSRICNLIPTLLFPSSLHLGISSNTQRARLMKAKMRHMGELMIVPSSNEPKGRYLSNPRDCQFHQPSHSMQPSSPSYFSDKRKKKNKKGGDTFYLWLRKCLSAQTPLLQPTSTHVPLGRKRRWWESRQGSLWWGVLGNCAWRRMLQRRLDHIWWNGQIWQTVQFPFFSFSFIKPLAMLSIPISTRPLHVQRNA